MRALGLIETKGLIGVMEALDAACKTADVCLEEIEYTGSSMCAIKITGEVADVKAAIDAGTAAASKLGEVISSHVIPRPSDDVDIDLVRTPMALFESTGIPDGVRNLKKK